MRLSSAAAAALFVVGCSDPPPPAVEPRRTAPSAVVEAPEPLSTRTLLSELDLWDVRTSPERRAAAEEVARRLPEFDLLRMESFSCGGQTHEVAVYRHAKTEMEFVLVPVGTFEMRATSAGKARFVRLTEPFLAARTMVTRAGWSRAMGGPPADADRGLFPAVDMSWAEAKTFCDRTDLALPTEAQWEWACRAGTTTRWYTGDRRANRTGDSATDLRFVEFRAVTQEPPNAFGLHDMYGNGGQWCADWYGPYPSGAATDPAGPRHPRYAVPRPVEHRVVRGDEFGDGEPPSSGRRDECHVSGRSTIGLRPVKAVPIR